MGCGRISADCRCVANSKPCCVDFVLEPLRVICVTPDTSEHAGRVRRYFDERVADYDTFYEPPYAAVRAFNRVFRKAVYLRRDQVITLARQYGCRTMLDVGCGSGRNSVWFVRNGIPHVHGI